MYGAIVRSNTAGYGLLTTDHAASSYGLPVFVPLNTHYEPSGDPAMGPAEVGPLTSCAWVGELPLAGNPGDLWSPELRDAVLAAGFTFEH